MREQVVNRLQNSSALLKFAVLKDLLGFNSQDEEYIKARNEAWKDPITVEIIKELKNWPGNTLKRHNDAKLLIHKLSFLADLGFTINDKRMKDIVGSILKNRSPEGVFQVMINIPKRFGGTGEDQYSWMLCDAPLLMYSLVRLGVDMKQLERGLDYLFSLGADFGYPCGASPDLGRFNGPGKRGTLCPYANLLMAKLYSLFPEKHNDELCRFCIEAMLDHMDKRDKRYLFGVGTDFNKLKFPFIWYDILHVADVLSHFDYALKDSRFLKLIDLIKEKEDENQLYIAESVWMAWKQIDSGQKKEPSLWITWVVNRIFRRIG